MTGAVFGKELTEYVRDRRFIAVLALLVLLVGVTAIDGWNRWQGDQAARLFAESSDREIWVEQGENNPHGAAHFARYAFRQTPPLASFDPGVFDHAGSAFWMEAHTQNPTTLRRVEDAAVATPFAALSPAWVIQIVGTLALALLLFPSVAGEVERGTFRALAANGASASPVATGKVAAVLVPIGLVLGLSLVVVAIISAASGSGEVSFARILFLLAAYAAGLLAFALVVMAISARARTASSAFAAAAVFWVVAAIAIPAIGGQLASTLHPDIDEQELRNAIQLEAQTPFWAGDAQEAAVAAYEAEVLETYGAESFDELGFDREAMILQAHEEFANAVYDRLYGELEAQHLAQDNVLRLASILSPVLALQRVSAGVSGTDLMAQQRFATDSEQHRRVIIEQLNRYMMENAGDQGFAFMAGRELWETTPDFTATSPSLGDVFARYWLELLVLVAWLIAGFWLALTSIGHAFRREAR